MSINYIGKIPLSVALPASVTCVADISASLTAALAPLAIELTAALECQISLGINPPNLAAAISAVIQILVELNLGLSLSLPMLNFQVAAVAALIAQIGPIVASLSASLGLSLPLAELLGTAGIQAFSFSGDSAEFGPLVESTLVAGTPDGQVGNASCVAFILASTASGTWTGMQSFFTLIPPSQPSDSFEYIGGVSLGALCGGLGSGILSANLSLNAQLGALTAQLNGALALSASLSASPPSFTGNIAIAGQLKSALQAYLSVGGFISAAAGITAIANLVAQLNAIKVQLTANISAMAAITAALTTSGVLCYSYNGTIDGIGAAITGEVGGGWNDGTSSTAPSNALVLVGTAGVTSSLMGTFFGGL